MTRVRILRAIISLVGLLMIRGAGHAQPAASVGHQLFSISLDECMGRARRALEAEGYAWRHGNGGINWGSKSIHQAAMVCSEGPRNQTLVEIFVASASHDGGVPGYEREKLQARMNAAASPPGPPGGGNLPRNLAMSAGEWVDNGRSLGTITFAADGTARATWIDVPHHWWFDGNDLMVAANGVQWVTRLRFDPGSNTFSGDRDRSNQTQDDVHTVLKPIRGPDISRGGVSNLLLNTVMEWIDNDRSLGTITFALPSRPSYIGGSMIMAT